MKRLLAAIVLALMVLPALVMIVPSTDAHAAVGASVSEASFTDPNGITLRLMTDSDVQEMRESVGTRLEGVDYDVIVDGHHTGLAPPSSESWESLVGDAWLAQAPLAAGLSAPGSYDMSSNSWFPIVGDQARQGSCAAWAATYYCYGAVEAKDNGWTQAGSGNTAQLLSPAWTYNRVASRALGGGSWMSENFAVIRDWGVPSLSTFPYTDSNAVNWGSAAAWREAPLHRGYQLVFLSANDGTINAIKGLVAGDQPVGRVEISLDPGSDRAKGVEALGAGPLAVSFLQVTRSDVITCGVSQDVFRRLFGGNPAAALAHHHHQLGFMFHLLRLGRQDDRIAGADD